MGVAYDSPMVTIELHVATASVLLELLLTEKRSDSEEPELFTRAWHREQMIAAAKAALLHWPPG